MPWFALDNKIYQEMFVIISEAGIDIPIYMPKEANDELLLITGLLNAIGHFTKLAWDLEGQQSAIKGSHNLKLVTAWWRLVKNTYDEVPTKDTIDASESEVYDWNRLMTIIVRFYLNRVVMDLTSK